MFWITSPAHIRVFPSVVGMGCMGEGSGAKMAKRNINTTLGEQKRNVKMKLKTVFII